MWFWWIEGEDERLVSCRTRRQGSAISAELFYIKPFLYNSTHQYGGVGKGWQREVTSIDHCYPLLCYGYLFFFI